MSSLELGFSEQDLANAFANADPVTTLAANLELAPEGTLVHEIRRLMAIALAKSEFNFGSFSALEADYVAPARAGGSVTRALAQRILKIKRVKDEKFEMRAKLESIVDVLTTARGLFQKVLGEDE